MPELKDLAKKKPEDLSREEASRLAYSRSTVSLDDYDPSQIAPEDRVKDNAASDIAEPPLVTEAPEQPLSTTADPAPATDKSTTK